MIFFLTYYMPCKGREGLEEPVKKHPAMELEHYTAFTLVFTFLLFLLMRMKPSKTSKLPPGPSKLPLIGHLHHLFGLLPHHSLRDLARIHGPLMHLKLGEVSAVVISSAGVAKQMMKTHDLVFLDRASYPSGDIMSYGRRNIVMAPYGEYWTQVRKICTLQLLSAKRVQSFWSVREEVVLNLIGRISLMAGSPMNLSENIFTLTHDILSRAAFGSTCKDKQVFISSTKEMIRLASGFAIPDVFPSLKFLGRMSGNKAQLERIHKKVDTIIEDIIREHKENRIAMKEAEVEEDLLDVLLKHQEEVGTTITIENVKAVTIDMFAAGTDTSSTTLEWTFSELLRDPRVMGKAQAEVRQIFNGKTKIDQADVNELNYLRLVIKEALRLHPPLPLLLPRESRERCELEGYEIPKGTRVVVNAWAIGRDPDCWRDPERFEPERFQDVSIDYKGTNFEYIPFGAGRRICPGILFGIANVELPLALLLYHFDWKLANGVKPQELDMTEAFSAVVNRKNYLNVIPTPYNPKRQG